MNLAPVPTEYAELILASFKGVWRYDEKRKQEFATKHKESDDATSNSDDRTL